MSASIWNPAAPYVVSTDVFNVRQCGAVGDGVTDDTAACQAAVNAAILAGRGTVFFPAGQYLLNGATSSDTRKNGILIPSSGGNSVLPYLRIVGDGGVTLIGGSDDMVMIRVSDRYVEVSQLHITAPGKTGVTAIGVLPEDLAELVINYPKSQSYFLSHGVTCDFCSVGIEFQPGPTDIFNRQSGCFYHNIYGFHGNTVTTHLKFNYPADYVAAPSVLNSNYTTRTSFFGCSFVNGNCGVYADGVGDIYFYDSSIELINAGTSPCAVPTGLYAPAHGYSAKDIQMFGGYIEACTRTIDTENTRCVATYGTVYAAPTGTAANNIVRLDRDMLQLSYDVVGANTRLSVDSVGGFTLMADSGAAVANTLSFIGIDGVKNIALTPFTKISNVAAPTGNSYHEMLSDSASNPVVKLSHSHATTPQGVRMTFSGGAPNNGTQYFWFLEDNANTKAALWSNGTISLSGFVSTLAAAPTYTITANAITPTAQIGFVGAGLIKTIDAPSRISTSGGTITIIPTAAFTTDATGNIAIASTAVISRAMTFTFDTTTNKWYPSY